MVFIPYHFISDVAKKIVFLRREQIETWLFGSVCFSAGITLVELVYEIFTKQLNLFTGKIPLLVLIITTALLFMLYAIFKESVFKLYDDLQDFVFLDSVLSDAINQAKDISIEPEMSEITDVVEEAVVEDVEESGNESEKDLTDTYQPTFNVKEVSTKQDPVAVKHEETDLEREALAAIEAATLQNSINASMKSAATSKNDTETVTVKTLNAEAKKVLYKNKMLAAIRGKLDNLTSARNLSEDVLNKACETEEFIQQSDFNSAELNVDIDEILF